MSKKILVGSLFATALAVGATIGPVHAGHGMGQEAQDRMSEFMKHHGFLKPGAQQDRPAKLGVAIAAIPQADLDKHSIEYGVRIAEVMNGSVAERAGLKAGDVVTAINDRPAYSPERLQYLVGKSQGESTIALVRDGESLKLQAALPKPEKGKAMLGVRIQEMTDELKDAFGTQGAAGVLISQVSQGSAAKQVGLKAGDVIVSMGGEDITAVAEVHGVLAKYAPGDELDLIVVRERAQQTMKVALGSSASKSQPKRMKSNGMWGHGKHHGGQGHGYGHHDSYGMMPKHGCNKMRKGQWSS